MKGTAEREERRGHRMAARAAATVVGVVAAAGCQLGATAPPADEPPAAEAPAEVEVVQEEQVRREFTETDRLEVPIDGYPADGPPDAPVTIVYATSFTCPFCARSRVTLRQLEEEYGDRLRIVTRLRLIGPDGLPPAVAACAAHRQGRFHAYSELLWDRAALDGDFTDERLAELAERAGLDLDRFHTDAASASCQSWVTEGDEALIELGLRGAPSFVINGRVIVGAQPIDVFRDAIDDELGDPQAS